MKKRALKKLLGGIMISALVAGMAGQMAFCNDEISAAKKASLATKSITLTVSQKKTIKIKNKKKGAKYSFASSSKKIAKVTKKGVVTGVKKGSAKITVKEKSKVKGKMKTRKIGVVKVTVRKADVIPNVTVAPTIEPTQPVVQPTAQPTATPELTPSPTPDVYTKQLFSVEINEEVVETVEGSTVTVDMKYFTGDVSGEYFNGSVLNESSNVVKTYKDGKTTNRAIFILNGTDDTGAACKLFIQDEGVKNGDTFVTSPIIITDSSSLRWMEKADIQGRVKVDEDGTKTVTYYWNESSTKEKEDPVIKRPDETKTYDKELFRFFIGIGASDEVKSLDRSTTLIHFNATGDFDNFVGETVRGSVDTRLRFPGQVEALSARYILEGTDKDGNPCRIYVENNGIDDNGMVTEPTIITDCPDYAWIETAPLHGTVSWVPQLTIHVWTTSDAAK